MSADRIHLLDLKHVDDEEVAPRYESELQHHLGQRRALDCVVLSLGEDVHIASLFPGKPAIAETERLVVAVTDSPKPPSRRVTMTLPLINRASVIHLLAVGQEKAEALRGTLSDPVNVERWPVQGWTQWMGACTSGPLSQRRP